VPESQILCLEHPHPREQEELVTLATDDAIFVHTAAAAAERRVAAYDNSLAQHGIPRSPDKDVTGADTIVALGCVLSNDPPWVEPELPKLFSLMLGIVGLCERRRATSDALSSILGTAQWFCQITRWPYSCFLKVYEAARREPMGEQHPVTRAVLDELLTFLLLVPLLPANLERPFAPFVGATDAAPEFGFGVCAHPADDDLLTELSCLSETRGDYVTCQLGTETVVERTRKGHATQLPFPMDDFRTILSIKAARVEHSGKLEAQACLLYVQWVLRAARRFGTRLVTLIDAKVLIYGLLKGRSSAPTVGPVLRSIAAHCLFGDLMIYPLYVPSEWNPADLPSRGGRREQQLARHRQRRLIAAQRAAAHGFEALRPAHLDRFTWGAARAARKGQSPPTVHRAAASSRRL